jgi:hypothetical protein
MPNRSAQRVVFVIKPNLAGSNGWLALRDDLAPAGLEASEIARDLARRFAGVQAWFSDLDDFDTRSPAKIIALKAVGAGRLNPAYARWLLETIVLVCRHGKKRAEAISWKRYYDAFLKQDADADWLKDEAFTFIDEMLTPGEIDRLLYPAVPEFYASFEADKYLVTRNLERIAYRYSKVLPYSRYYHEVEDKAALVEAFIEAHPEIKSYGSGGDSEEDAEVAEVLDLHYRKGEIEKPICLFRAGLGRSLDLAFNVFVGKNRSGLSGILSGWESLVAR